VVEGSGEAPCNERMMRALHAREWALGLRNEHNTAAIDHVISAAQRANVVL